MASVTAIKAQQNATTSSSGRRLTIAAYVLAGLMLIACVGVKLLQHYSFGTNDSDTSIYANVAWNLANGNGFYSSLLQRNHLGEHFSPVMGLFAPLMQIHPTVYWLMLVQGLAVGLFLVVLVRLSFVIGRWHGKTEADTRASAVIALCILVLAFMFTPLVNALCFEFHPSTLAMPLIALALLAIHEERQGLLWGMVAVLLTTKESAVLAIIGLGLYAWLVCGRRRQAFALFAVAGGAALLIFKLIIPHFRAEGWGHYSRLGPLQHWDAKAQYMLLLVLPLAFLPLLQWRALLPALPLIALNLSVAYQPQFSMNFHYDDMSSVFLLVAALHGAHRIERWNRKSPRALRSGLVVALLLFSLFNKGHSPLWSSPLKFIPRFWPTQTTAQLHKEVDMAMAQLPPESGVASQEGLGPRLCFRMRYMMLNDTFDTKRLRPGDHVLLTPVGQHVALPDLDEFRERLLSAGLRPIHSSEVLEIYQMR